MKHEHTGTLDETIKMLGSIEAVEDVFGIEFSCGDGKFFSDLDQALLSKYDGKVDSGMFRENATKRIKQGDFLFTFRHDEETGKNTRFSVILILNNVA